MTGARRALVLALVALATESMSIGCSSDSGQDAGASDARQDVSPLDAIEDAAPDAITADVASDVLQDDQICARKCELDAAIGCNPDNAACVAQCRSSMSSALCYAESRAAVLCVIAIGQDALTCMSGRPFVKPGYCEEEKRALTACVNGTARDAGMD